MRVIFAVCLLVVFAAPVGARGETATLLANEDASAWEYQAPDDIPETKRENLDLSQTPWARFQWRLDAAVIATHSAAALLALFMGAAIFSGRKGTPLHRRLGWVYVGLMAVVATTAAFIQDINPGRYSLIHLLILVTIVGLWWSLRGIRRYRRTRNPRHLRQHIVAMISTFFFALVLAGVFTLLPGRIFHRLLFG